MVKIIFNPAIEGLEHKDGKYFFDGIEFNDDTVDRLQSLGIKPFNGDLRTGRSLTPEAIEILKEWKMLGAL
jgi:hypothetical protein